VDERLREDSELHHTPDDISQANTLPVSTDRAMKPTPALRHAVIAVGAVLRRAVQNRIGNPSICRL
jgi:hypothetical protein